MTTKEQLHRLVDELPESELEAAERYLAYLRAIGSSALLRALIEAPYDAEPVTPEDAAAIAEAYEAVARGEVVSDTELQRELGL
jgi:outer membrane protein assembly factor BamD (BamD/ComL family)